MNTLSVLLLLAVANLATSTTRNVGWTYLGQSDPFQPTPGAGLQVKKYYVTKFLTASFVGAFNFCKSNGMQLARFDDLKETANFAEFFNLNAVGVNFAWVDGLSNTVRNGDWRYLENGAKSAFYYNVNEPDYNLPTEHCIIAMKQTVSKSAIFGNNACNLERFVACQELAAP
jgi:hypothetical protein